MAPASLPYRPWNRRSLAASACLATPRADALPRGAERAHGSAGAEPFRASPSPVPDATAANLRFSSPSTWPASSAPRSIITGPRRHVRWATTTPVLLQPRCVPEVPSDPLLFFSTPIPASAASAVSAACAVRPPPCSTSTLAAFPVAGPLPAGAPSSRYAGLLRPPLSSSHCAAPLALPFPVRAWLAAPVFVARCPRRRRAAPGLSRFPVVRPSSRCPLWLCRAPFVLIRLLRLQSSPGTNMQVSRSG
ncbi:LOW QUALITY PROTEIN: hypothetical protein U9M48_034564 [Paspalum notatum var. saurae]|uniref:Uncharacterized protein n=1 Tax=Paspalum notatum var. saurae TaxID=547442 RepID=A0AAQ3X913_PASNO